MLLLTRCYNHHRNGIFDGKTNDSTYIYVEMYKMIPAYLYIWPKNC